MADMLKDVITMLFAGECYCACTVEKQDTSTRIAGNDNIRNCKSPEEGTHAI